MSLIKMQGVSFFFQLYDFSKHPTTHEINTRHCNEVVSLQYIAAPRSITYGISFHANSIDFLSSVLPKAYHLSINKFGLILENTLKLWSKMNVISLLVRNQHPWH